MAIRTTVGFCAHGENFFRGRAVGAELLGREGFWSALSIGIDGPRLGPSEARLLDELSVAVIAPDPRIWPLKLVWLGGAYGGTWAAVAVATVYAEQTFAGPAGIREAGRVLVELAALDGDDAIVDWFAEQRGVGRVVAGFGVPGRAEDERIPWIMSALRRCERASGPHLQLARSAVRLVGERARLRPNMALVLAACLLDLGYDPRQASVIAQAMASVQVWAHADEAARQAPAALRCLDPAEVRYEGPAPRRSRRSRERRG